MDSSEPLDFITCSWQRRRYLRTCSLPPPGLYSPNEDLFRAGVFSRVSFKRASGQGNGQQSTAGRGTRVRKLVDLCDLRRQALGSFDPLLEVGIVGQLSLGLRVQLVQLEEGVVRRAQPHVVAHLVGLVGAFSSSSCLVMASVLCFFGGVAGPW